jgi:hypothetical protein
MSEAGRVLVSTGSGDRRVERRRDDGRTMAAATVEP